MATTDHTIPHQKKAIIIIAIIFLIAIFTSNNTALFYYCSLLFFFVTMLSFNFQAYKFTFLSSGFLLIVYTFHIGIFGSYMTQDLMSYTLPEERILGYGAMATFPFILLSILSVWFLIKTYKTLSSNWYITFMSIAILCSINGIEGYGSNYWLKLTFLGLNLMAFTTLRKKHQATLPQ